jgi:simple sugar transport system permease protein
MSAVSAFMEATVRTATPLALAALGEVVAERAGIINIGLEGIILSGALGAVIGAPRFGVIGGYGTAIVAGAAIAALFGWFVVYLRTDQIIAGTAVTLFAVGLTGTIYRSLYGTTGTALTVPTSGPVRIPGLAAIPVIGSGFFNQPIVTYVTYALVPAVWWWMYRTQAGLAVRAIGESRSAAAAAGIRVDRVRFATVMFGGVLGGVAGAMLVLAQTGTFVENMSAGRGFIAIAIVVLARWHPVGVGLAALLFGAASALQYLLQALGLAVPYQLFLSLPYVLTLGVLAGVAGRVRAPAELAREDVAI